MRKVSPGKILVLVLVVIVFSACAENEEGCLDVRAVNFDIEADKNCCCEYPVMNLEVSPIFGSDTLPFSVGDPFVSAGGTISKILESRFYSRQIELESFEGESFLINDELDLCYLESTSGEERMDNVIDDVFLYNLGNLRYEIGTFPDASTYQRLSLSLGLGDTLANACRNDLPNGHPLRNAAMYSDQQGKIQDLRLIVIPDTMQIEDTLYLSVSGLKAAALINRDIVIPESRDFIIPLTFDYKTWLNDIDFANENEESIVNKLIQNFPNSWDIKD